MVEKPAAKAPEPASPPKTKGSDLASLRKTESMGIARDTVRDLKLPFADELPRGPRGTVQIRNPGHPLSDRREGGEIAVGVVASPKRLTARKVDISSAHPSLAKTQKVSRRPSDYLPREHRDASVARDVAPPEKLNRVGIVAFFLLLAIAIALGVAIWMHEGPPAGAPPVEAPSGRILPATWRAVS